MSSSPRALFFGQFGGAGLVADHDCLQGLTEFACYQTRCSGRYAGCYGKLPVGRQGCTSRAHQVRARWYCGDHAAARPRHELHEPPYEVCEQLGGAARLRRGARVSQAKTLHTGAHKINNAIYQIVMARRMGKTRIIAETGAGQHGVACAAVCAVLNEKQRTLSR